MRLKVEASQQEDKDMAEENATFAELMIRADDLVSNNATAQIIANAYEDARAVATKNGRKTDEQIAIKLRDAWLAEAKR